MNFLSQMTKLTLLCKLVCLTILLQICTSKNLRGHILIKISIKKHIFFTSEKMAVYLLTQGASFF